MSTTQRRTTAPTPSPSEAHLKQRCAVCANDSVAGYCKWCGKPLCEKHKTKENLCFYRSE